MFTQELDGKKITLKGCTGHNLKNVSVDFPLGKFICVTGVSGSGKSSLINGTLYPLLSEHFYNSEKKPLAYKSITGLDNIRNYCKLEKPIQFHSMYKSRLIWPQAIIDKYPSEQFSHMGIYINIQDLSKIVEQQIAEANKKNAKKEKDKTNGNGKENENNDEDEN
jgi:energy-coupling factor transporter ATP-binding protein EcfA2